MALFGTSSKPAKFPIHFPTFPTVKNAFLKSVKRRKFADEIIGDDMKCEKRKRLDCAMWLFTGTLLLRPRQLSIGY